jgi:hypothetical protein
MAREDVEPTRVLYIAGAARSGSTLLTRLLALSAGAFAAGEMFHMWSEGAVRNDPCGCGLPFRDCPVWGAVARAVPALGDAAAAEVIAGRQARLSRARRLGDVWTARSRRRLLQAFPPDHLAALGAAYRALREQTGARVIVDSSKSPLYAYVLAHAPGIDLAVVHLVRDPRATAGSRAVAKFDAQRSLEFQPARSASRAAVSWLASHASADAMVRALGLPAVVLRYEDFVGSPRTALASVYPAGWADAPPVDRTVVLPPAHLVAGDPDRFEHGEVHLELRDDWKARIPRGRKMGVTALTLRHLRRYGYGLAL